MLGEAGVVDPHERDRRGRGAPGAVHGEEIRKGIVPRSQRLGPGLVHQRQTGQQGEKHKLRSGAKHGAQLGAFRTRLQHK